jgi:hypothetical protein
MPVAVISVGSVATGPTCRHLFTSQIQCHSLRVQGRRRRRRNRRRLDPFKCLDTGGQGEDGGVSPRRGFLADPRRLVRSGTGFTGNISAGMEWDAMQDSWSGQDSTRVCRNSARLDVESIAMRTSNASP